MSIDGISTGHRCLVCGAVDVELISERDALKDEVAQLSAWMDRVKAMLNREDMTGIFVLASVHGVVLSQDTKREVTEVWDEYALLRGRKP